MEVKSILGLDRIDSISFSPRDEASYISIMDSEIAFTIVLERLLHQYLEFLPWGNSLVWARTELKRCIRAFIDYWLIQLVG